MVAELSLSDISAVIRLVRETCDRWDDPAAWRGHLLRGACELVAGTMGMMIRDHDSPRGRFGRLSVVSAVGIPPAMRDLVGPAVSEMAGRAYEDASRNVMPGMERLYADMERQGWVTLARRDITDDDAYHQAPHYLNFRRQLGCDDYMVSIRIVDVPRRPEAISVDRPAGAPRFGPREVAILKLLHDEIAPLVGVRLATERHLCRDGLSKRLNETLSLLLEGKSEKEAAAALGLSPRTVHEYVTMLYGHFRVSSRGELMAYFVRRAPLAKEFESNGAAPRPAHERGTPRSRKA